MHPVATQQLANMQQADTHTHHGVHSSKDRAEQQGPTLKSQEWARLSTFSRFATWRLTLGLPPHSWQGTVPARMPSDLGTILQWQKSWLKPFCREILEMGLSTYLTQNLHDKMSWRVSLSWILQRFGQEHWQQQCKAKHNRHFLAPESNQPLNRALCHSDLDK